MEGQANLVTAAAWKAVERKSLGSSSLPPSAKKVINSRNKTPEYREKMSASMKLANKRSNKYIEGRKKASETMKKIWASGTYGERRIFVENSNAKPETIKRYLIEERGHKCQGCNYTEWFGNKIPLTIHHKNGIKKDMRKENIDLLCPNCHTFTDNFCYKAVKRKTVGIRLDEELVSKASNT